MDFFQSSEFDSQVQRLMDDLHVPGLSAAVLHDDKTAAKAFGVISVASGAPCTPDSLFDIASASKILTALSVALLVEEGSAVTYDTPVAELLPGDFVLSDPEYTKNVTVDDILGHRTGLPSHDQSYFGVDAEHPDDALSVTRNLRNLQLCAPLRSRYIYSNIMYTVASRLVEARGRDRLAFADFLDARVFAPLGMTSSSLQPSRSRARGHAARLASGHVWDPAAAAAAAARHHYREFAALECPEGQGAGSVITSARDYLQLVAALLHPGRRRGGEQGRDGQPVVSEAVYAGLTRIRSVPKPAAAAAGGQQQQQQQQQPLSSPRFYCAGLMVEYYRGHAVFGHNGGVPGFGSRFFFVPSLRFGAVLLGNALEAAAAAVHLQKALLDHILGPVGDDAGRSSSSSSSNERPRQPGAAAQPTTASPGDDEPQQMPLTAYAGRYWNPGYRGFRVQVRGGEAAEAAAPHLFIDARDRSFACTLRLRHVAGQTSFLAYVTAAESVGGLPVDDEEPLRAEFRFDNDRAVKFGLLLDPDLDLIWFDRVHAEAAPYVFV